MRKAILLAAAALSAATLSAAFFSSNALGQDLGPIPALAGSGYEGESSDGRIVIYSDGVPVRERLEDESGYTVTAGGIEEIVAFDSEGRRRSWTLRSPGREETHTYFYDGSRLASVSVSVDGNLERRVVYLETPSGTLAGLSGSGRSYISPDFYIYEEDDGFVRFSYHESGRTVRTDSFSEAPEYTIADDGCWTERTVGEDGEEIIRRYDPQGRLAEETAGGVITAYAYGDDGDLSEVSVTDGGSVEHTIYSNGRRVASEYLLDGIMQRERHYPDDGGIEEIRYRDGIPEYRILFDGDGQRVKEVERL